MPAATVGKDEVLYTQRTGPWGRRVCWGLLALLFVGGLLSELDQGLRYALISAVAYVVAWGIPVWIALLTIASIDRYGKVELTRAQLRVGRATLPTAQIDRGDLLLQAREDEGAARRWSHVLAGADLPAERIVGQAPMLGGAYGSTYGSWVLTIRLTEGGWRRIDVKRPAELLDALLRARTGQEPQAG